MGLLVKSEEEKAAKAVKAEEKARQAAAKAEAVAHQAWLATPQGQARTAADRGDQLLQVSFEVVEQAGEIYWGAVASTPNVKSVAKDPTSTLNAIAAEGWDLVSASFTFVQTKEQSREAVIGSRQMTAISGKTVGYYVFRAAD
jgi:hypothetical protein